MRIRDSFKSAYLKKLEWNLHRMNNEKKQRSQETSDSNQQRLLDDEIFSCSSLVAIAVSVVEVASTRTRNDAVSEGIKGSLEIIFQKENDVICDRNPFESVEYA
ncbi:hypothetical protein OIU77_013320 [Salix suchowensis]|uniref:Uncharacterized protein n=1 Tax=Salix suchowensis TaxID=1278906 RepID=A0ABQ8ZTF0_9ROSI|nr:hypothetical protein OIU77_013320 [Salix suchowensis]